MPGPVLITGATGYLGRRVAAAIAARGGAVHAVTRGTEVFSTETGVLVPEVEARPLAPKAPFLWKTPPSPSSSSSSESIAWHQGDLLSPGAPARLIAATRPALLLHLAWDVTPGAYWTSPSNERWQAATAALAKAFFDAGGRRFVGAGTCAEYDWTGGVCDEATTPIAPASVYGKAKAAAWRAVAEIAAATGGRAAWGRVFFPYGGDDEHPSRLVPSVRNAIRRGEPALCTPGDQRRDFLHVDEVAKAFVALALSDVTGAVNLGSGKARPVRELVMEVAEELGRPDLVRLGALPADPVPLVEARIERLTREVGWTPEL